MQVVTIRVDPDVYRGSSKLKHFLEDCSAWGDTIAYGKFRSCSLNLPKELSVLATEKGIASAKNSSEPEELSGIKENRNRYEEENTPSLHVGSSLEVSKHNQSHCKAFH